MDFSKATVDELIVWLEEKVKNNQEDDIGLDPRNGGMDIAHLKMVAERWKIPKSQNKGPLVANIVARIKNKEALQSGQFPVLMPVTPVATPSSFKKDKNTFPRLCNILMKTEDSLARSQLIAGRLQLQYGQTREHHPVWVCAAEDFNDYSKSSGGLQFPDEVLFTEGGIDPDAPNTGGAPMTSKDAYEEFHTVLKRYNTCLSNFERSGRHAELNFWDFCKNLDVLYLYYWHKSTHSMELQRFMTSSSMIAGGGGGLDTAARTFGKNQQSATSSVSSESASVGPSAGTCSDGASSCAAGALSAAAVVSSSTAAAAPPPASSSVPSSVAATPALRHPYFSSLAAPSSADRKTTGSGSAKKKRVNVDVVEILEDMSAKRSKTMDTLSKDTSEVARELAKSVREERRFNYLKRKSEFEDMILDKLKKGFTEQQVRWLREEIEKIDKELETL